MTREEFKNEMKRLNKERASITKDFIESMNIDLYKGKKVRCFRQSWRTEEYEGDGFVAGVDLSYGEPYYKINKIKKDGTMANVGAGYWFITRVELIEE